MFDSVPLFWTNLISFLSGVLIIIAVYRHVTSRKKKILFDSYSYRPLRPLLPTGIDYAYRANGQDHQSIFFNRIFIKNETGEALANNTLIEPLSVKIENTGKLIMARLLDGPDASRVTPEFRSDTETLHLNDLIIPVDGALEIEVVTEEVVNPIVRGTHNSAKLLHRNYGGIIWSNSLLLLSGMASLFVFMTLDTVLRAIGYQGMLKPLDEISKSMSGAGAVLFFLFSMASPFLFALICAFGSRLLFPMTNAEKQFASRKYIGWKQQVESR
ncbi:MAG: hypothetical protein EOO38_22445 [Cytophagaceae bacterium]|nr:MAG: hypothetical protein EOO38_22445 [Cytophagaceae bacterium]